jgi:hypothetical protein
MEIKNSLAIKAGVIGGVGLAILIVINSGFEVIGSWTTSLLSLIGCCMWLVEIVVLLGTGALAVKYTAGYLKDTNDALMAGALSGGVAGLIGAVVTVIMAFITPLISGTTYTGSELPEGLGTGLGLSVLGGFGTACCCAPIYIVVAIVLGAIGAVIYQAVAKK